MKKKDFVSAISKTSGMAKRDSEAALNAVISCLSDLLARGDSIVLPKLGSLSVKKRNARTGRNPSTGKPMNIPASNVVSFKSSSKLKEAINNQAK